MGILDVSCLDKFSKGVRSLDSEEFRKQASQTVDFIADYYKDIEKLPVLSRVEPGYLVNQLPKSPPHQPESFDTILKDIQTQIMPGMTHWLSPNFFAYFPATVSTAAYIGEMLCTAFNAVGFNWLASPAATELEMVVMDWLAILLNLPQKFMFSGTGGGVIQGTTSEAILCTIVTARDRALERIGNKNIGRLVVYGSDQTHSTFAKACKIAGILPENIRYIATKADKAFSLSPELVEQTMELDVKKGLVPIYLCITVGTTSSTAVDPLPELAQVAGKFDAWVHVDAAYAGSACICPEYRHLIDGVEMVDSISLSPHKWLLTYLDCCCLWVSNPSLLVKGLSTDPEYLKNKPSESKSVIDYKDWQIGTGRRFRALKLWLVLRIHGVENLQSHIRSDIRMAKHFENLVLTDSRFEVVTARQLGLICFRLKPHSLHFRNEDESRKRANEMNQKLIDSVNASGKIYITHTVIDSIYVIRFAVGATLTEDHHVQAAWKLIQETADELLRGN